ncbi:hypothetical protein V6N13_018235 [Hibiscus sabdariffa]
MAPPEGLSSVLSNAVILGIFEGVNVGYGKLSISHLQFADDLIIFYGASATQIKNVKCILRCFELAVGLHLNLKKSALFGINVEAERITYWVKSLRCSTSSFPSSYLGLPLGNMRNSTLIWRPVLDKIRRRLAP